uniref:Uncharacterized protein n=1 Tax=Trichogramma kaykai TaxID=54128 RepID=A0ABD2XIS9_9HYME
MAEDNQKCLKELKRMREEVDWEVIQERKEFLRKLYPLFRDWTGQLPNLRDIFRPGEIDCLLAESVNSKLLYYTDLSICLLPLIEFVIKTGYKDEPEVDEDGQIRRTTPIHYAARRASANGDDLFRALFKIYDRLDVDYIDDFGSTHFHAACQAGCDAVVQKYLELGRNPDLLVKTSGDSPLLLALERGHDKVAESLLRRGANPNLANEKRETPLHVICQRNKDDDEALEMLFELSNDRHRPVLLDVQDNLGNTPLHLAVYYDNEKVAKKLLQRGTNPNLTDVERLTPLHTICKSENMDNKKNVDLVKVIFEFHDKKNHPVSINAQDELGNTPLHLALDCRLELTAKFLLRTGADLRSINQENKTPLCILFKRDPHNLYALVKVLFEILHKADPPMPINAQNPWYEPPLLWSMSHLLPYLIDVHSTEYPDKWSLRKLKFKLASGVLAVVECLEKRQLYKLDRCDALTIMKFFVTHPLYKQSVTLDSQVWWSNDIRLAKNIEFPGYRTLYHVVMLRPEDANKRLTYANYFRFSPDGRFRMLSSEYRKACFINLYEKMSRRFFRKWTVHYFWELIRYRISLENCYKIIDESFRTKDLWNICLAAMDQSS